MKNRRKGIPAAAFPLTALAMALLAPIAAHANPCTVTSLADNGPGTLRALLGDVTCDPINFGSFGLSATITLTSGELVIARNVTINGPGASQMTVKRDSNAPAFSVFRIDTGTVTINGLTITNGHGVINAGGFAGGISAYGDNIALTLTNSTISGNQGEFTGGVFASGNIGLASLKISNSTISGNFCAVADSCIAGGINGWGASVTISGSTVSGNSGNNAGGILCYGPCTITSSKITGNTGGGIQSIDNLTITDSSISGNSNLSGGGGLGSSPGGNPAAVVVVRNSTISGNRITQFDFNAFGGGGIYTTVPMQLINSTVSGNIGGGLFVQPNCSHIVPKVAIVDSTFSGNTGGGPLFASSITSIGFNEAESGACASPSVTLKNTILTTGSGPNCMIPGPALVPYLPYPDSSFLPITDGGYNLENGNTCGFTGANSKPSTDPLLGPLQDNGGPTQTHALLTGSPAIDKGSCTDLNNNTVATDQRGVTRPQGFGCDIGAYEYRPAYPFAGFFQPVDNPPTKNVVKAGAAVPVKFSLGGDRGLNIFAANSPSSQATACDFTTPGSDKVSVTAGGSSLSYDPSTGTYTYVWKTDNVWSGTCRQLSLKLNDDTTHVANFQFK